MPDEFIDRLREAIIDPDTVDVDALRAAATNAATDLTPERALALMRLAHNRTVDAEAEVEVRGRLNVNGPVLEDHGQTQLLATLACEALIISFTPPRQRFQKQLLAALATRCAPYAGWEPVHPDLAAYAYAYLAVHARVVRQRLAAIPQVKRPPDADEGWQPSIDQRHAALEELVANDRKVADERDRLAWWLVSGSRPEYPLGVAAELAACLTAAPEPPAATQMLRAKLDRATPREGLPPVVTVPDEIADLCPDLFEAGAPEGLDVQSALASRCLHQLMLVRAAKEPR